MGNVLTMIVIGPFAFGIASLGQFQGPALWIAVILFLGNLGLFGWNTWTVARQNQDFVCLLTSERLVCQSPDERMAKSFELPICEIVKLTEETHTEEGRCYSIQTQSGESIILTSSFGNPARSFFEELRKLLPMIPVEKK